MTKFYKYYRYFVGLWAGVILVVSVIPGQDLPSLSIWEPDKVMHALVYGVLTYLLFVAISYKSTKNNLLIFAITLCILYGFIIELIQKVLPTRTFDMYDMLANTIGCLLAGGLILLISGRKSLKN
jgi:VanZ family protein